MVCDLCACDEYGLTAHVQGIDVCEACARILAVAFAEARGLSVADWVAQGLSESSFSASKSTEGHEQAGRPDRDPG